MSQEANVVVEPVCTHLETVKRFSYSVNVCCEAISVLIPQPDVEVQAEVGNKLCKELRNVIGLLSSTGDDVSTILKELFVSFHDFHRTYFLGKSISYSTNGQIQNEPKEPPLTIEPFHFTS